MQQRRHFTAILAAAQVLAFALAGQARAQQARVEPQIVAEPDVLAFHPKSNALVLVRDGAARVRMVDLADPTRPVVRLTLPLAAIAAAFLPDGRIVTAGRDDVIRIWSEAGQEAAPAIRPEGGISDMAVSPSGRLIAVQDAKQTLRIWSIAGRPLSPPVATPGRDRCGRTLGSGPVFSPDEKLVAFVTPCTTVAVATVEGRLVKIADMYQAPKDGIDLTPVPSVLAFSRDGRTLAARFVYQPGARIYLWPLAGGVVGAPRHAEALDGRDITSIAAGPAPNIFLMAGESRVIGVGAQGRPTALVFDLDKASRVVVSADGSRFAVSNRQRVVLLHRDGKPLVTGPFTGFVYTNGLRISPDGALILAMDVRDVVNLWNTSGARIGPRRSPDTDVRFIGFSRDGREFITVDRKGNLNQWLANGERAKPPFPLAGFAWDSRALPAWSGDRFVAPAGDRRSLQFYDKAGRKVGQPFASHAFDLDALALSPDGTVIATGVTTLTDVLLQFWNVDGTRIGEPARFERTMLLRNLEFSPDGRMLLAPASGAGPFTIIRPSAERPQVTRHQAEHLGFLADGAMARFEGGHVVIEAADGTVRRRAPIHSDFVPLAILPQGDRILARQGSAVRVVTLEAAARPDETGRFGIATEVVSARALPGGDLRVAYDKGFSAMTLGQAARNFSVPVGQRIAIWPDGTRFILPAETGKQRYLVLYGEEGTVLAPRIDSSGDHVAVSPDSALVAIARSTDHGGHAVLRYDRNGAALGLTEMDGWISGLAFSRDGATIAVAMDSVIRFLDREGRLLAPRIETGSNRIVSIAGGPDGSWLVTGGDKVEVRLWSRDGERLGAPLASPSEPIFATFTPNGGQILTYHQDGGLRLWAYAAPGRFVLETERPDLLIGEFGFVGERLWFVDSRLQMIWLDAKLNTVASAPLTPDGHLISLNDGRHCGAGPVFEQRRVFRGTAELSSAEREALVDCAAVKAALGGR